MFASGPTQSGKTLLVFVTTILYHLFEIGETVICGLPNMDMATDKWREDILPVIEKTRYRELLPSRGAGSMGGRTSAIRFRNGVTLRFMSSGGSDKSVAGYTSRVLVMTEIDGFDRSGETSRESDRITQLEARTRSFGDRKRIYGECTVSIADGRTWTEWKAGTQSKIALPCPHCGGYSIPMAGPDDRKLLVGWRDADDEIQVRKTAAFACGACGVVWTEGERRAANERGLLLHRGQEIVDGAVVGDPPETMTLGFRWSAVNNLFVTAGEVAADEFKAARKVDEDNAEREMLQFVWALPYVPAKSDFTPLDANILHRRVSKHPRGFVPDNATALSVAVDLGKWLAHWVAIAWCPQATGYVVDYGRLEIATSDLGVERAILQALRQFRDVITSGWARSNDEPMKPDQCWIDARFQPDVVKMFCRESKLMLERELFRPSYGRGASQDRTQRYLRPKTRSATVKHVGEEYHIAWSKTDNAYVVEVNADHWKSWVHERLSCPLDGPGALTLFNATPNEHTALVKHLTAEKQFEEFIPGKGVVKRWERVNRSNHWFDAMYNACAAGHFCGVRLVDVPRRVVATEPERPLVTMPDGRAFDPTAR